MSPRIQGDGGRRRVPAMKWKSLDDAQNWTLDFGPFRAEVWWSGLGWPWQIGLAGVTHVGVDAAFKREVRMAASTATLDAARVACEDAARDLLCSALAAFAEEMGPDVCLNWEVDGEAGMGTYDHYAATSPEDARALAIALLSASQAGGKP